MIGTILGAAASIGTGVASLIAGNRARRKQLYDQAQQRNMAAAEANRNYLEEDEAKSTLRQVRQNQDRQTRRLNTAAVRGGLTDEARVGMASANNETTGDAISRLAAVGASQNRYSRQQYRNLLYNQAQQNYATDMDRAGALAGTINGIGQAASGLNDAFASSGRNMTSTQHQPIKSRKVANVNQPRNFSQLVNTLRY